MTSPTGHQTFNGNALVVLCGQGAMYIERNQCIDAMDASQQSQSLKSPPVTVSAPI
uniref:Uncharacterized protein n=1 Tax=Amphimedon queenslandica TaxID=400682 RepID=A0A1X7TY18_AMPQE